jgi:tRNA pseudouridine38-40 synthase
MRNIKISIEYDGSEFCGWQIQPNVQTVQGEIERSLSQITQSDIKLTTAGRTDSGVHAIGQVANFKLESDLPLKSIVKGGNALLPFSIRLKNAEEVDLDFSARFDARSRSYRYLINTTATAIGRQYSWYFPQIVDVELMNKGCSYILGEHDFEAFCQSGSQLDHYRCFVSKAQWSSQINQLKFEISANRFVHNMVRIIVGTSLKVGRKKITPDYLKEILNSKDRKIAGATVPAHGLCLVDVKYKDEKQNSILEHK